MTEANDEVLVDAARGGDDLAIETLLARYRHYARAKARTYFLAGADKEDIVQEGMIGLYKAIRDFQAERNIAFRAFAELCMTRQIITAIKSASRQKHVPLNSYVSLNRPSNDADDGFLPDSLPGPVAQDPAELVISADEISALRSSMERILSPFETDVLGLYMDGKPYQEIGDILGRHVKSIDNALQRIKRKLEDHLARRSGRAQD